MNKQPTDSLEIYPQSDDPETALLLDDFRAQRRKPSKIQKSKGMLTKFWSVIGFRVFIISVISIIQVSMFLYELSVGEWEFAKLKENPLVGPPRSVLEKVGAKDCYSIKSGQWQLWIYPLFIHAGLIHLLVVLLFQVLSGIDLERRLYWWRILIVYIVSGVVGNVSGCLFLPGELTMGATGSLFGLYGLAFAELLLCWKKFKSPLCNVILHIISVSVTIVIGVLPFVDNFSHIGGLIAGFLCGLALVPSVHSQKRDKLTTRGGILLGIGLVLLALFVTITFALFYTNHDLGANCSWCKWIYCPIEGWCMASFTTP
mmetsp:Transcript_4106/g.4518  ORF Transcript_4106/g.4518 Transcript_4106/m.4518 type:complete len:315 (-) Transcript_4106:90-1034(-)